MLAGLTREQQDIIIKCLVERLRAHTIILFGTAAKERMRDDSDVDIAFMSDVSHSAYDMFITAQALAGQLDREVDLVDFNKTSTVLKAQIVASGKIILDQRPSERQIVFMRAYKEYAILNEERASILEKYGYSGGGELEPRYCHEQNGDNTTMHSENT